MSQPAGSKVDRTAEPLFKLRPSVTLPARLYAAQAVEEVAPPSRVVDRGALEPLLKHLMFTP
jgi:hypothetical protein